MRMTYDNYQNRSPERENKFERNTEIQVYGDKNEKTPIYKSNFGRSTMPTTE